jgi:predicted nucleic acid-binding Zn ribbon protein
MPLPFRFIPPRGPGKRSGRQRVLAEWRGFDAAPLETARAATARSMGSLLPRVLGNIRIDRRQSEAEIVKVWNAVLNPIVTQHAQPVGLAKGTLFVNVDSNAWLCELMRYHRKEILERLRHSFGKDTIARISFRVG